MKKTLAVVIALLYVGVIIYTTQGRASESRRALEQTVSVFENSIQRAKAETADPCGLNPIRLVQPPDGAERYGLKPVLVILGQDVTDRTSSINFSVREPAPGEKTVLVAYTPGSTPEWQEIGWLAYGTQACKSGQSEAIKSYAIFHPPFGDEQTRSPWPR